MSTIPQNHYVLAVHDAKRSAVVYQQTMGFRVVAEPAGWESQLLRLPQSREC